MKIEATCFSKTSVNFSSDDTVLSHHTHRCENLKSCNGTHLFQAKSCHEQSITWAVFLPALLVVTVLPSSLGSGLTPRKLVQALRTPNRTWRISRWKPSSIEDFHFSLSPFRRTKEYVLESGYHYFLPFPISKKKKAIP
jgi:hypothetical protein